MSAVTAWRIEVAPNSWIAIAEKNLIEYVNNARLTCVPLSPKGCDNLMKWRDFFIPVIDIKSRFDLFSEAAIRQMNSISNKIVVVYTENKPVDNPIKAVISIRILSTPERVIVDDDQMSEDISMIPLPLQSSVSSLFIQDNKLTAIYDWKKFLNIGQC